MIDHTEWRRRRGALGPVLRRGVGGTRAAAGDAAPAGRWFGRGGLWKRIQSLRRQGKISAELWKPLFAKIVRSRLRGVKKLKALAFAHWLTLNGCIVTGGAGKRRNPNTQSGTAGWAAGLRAECWLHRDATSCAICSGCFLAGLCACGGKPKNFRPRLCAW
jgi:hypothetical protein